MALPSTAVWEIRPGVSGASDNNGGGFDTAQTGTDYSQQASPQYSFTDLVLATTTTCSSVSHSFVSADVGNFINITAGTGFTTGIYEIISVAAGIATLDRAAGSASSTGGTWTEGGALNSLSKLNSNIVSGNIAWVLNTNIISITSGINLSTGLNSGALIGYSSSRGDNGQFTIKATSSNNSYALQVGTGWNIQNLIIDCNNEGPSNSTSGIICNNSSNGPVTLINVRVINCNGNYAFSTNGGWYVTMRNCTSANYAGTFQAFNIGGGGVGVLLKDCVAYGQSSVGYHINPDDATLINCISASSSGSGSHGFLCDAGSNLHVARLINCFAYYNAGDGFHLINSNASFHFHLENCITYGNSGYGINQIVGGGFISPPGMPYFDYNAYGDNTSGNLNLVNAGPHDVTLSVDPTVNGASQNYALNLTSGGGLGLQGTGFPGSLQTGGTGYASIGPLQPSGGGTTIIVPNQHRTILVGEI